MQLGDGYCCVAFAYSDSAYHVAQGPDDVMAMGIDKYNAECRAIVMRYSADWRETVSRLGRWIDFDNVRVLQLPCTPAGPPRTAKTNTQCLLSS